VFNSLRTAFRIQDLRKRIFFTFWMLLILRVGTHITVPGLNPAAIQQLFTEGSIFNFLDIFSGGAFKQFSILAMSITPYVNASIIINLLCVVIPSWEKMMKEPDGQKVINRYTRYGTVILGVVTGFGMAYSLKSAIITPGPWSYALITLTLTAGTAFVMWLGEQITDKGIGNGISLIIFANIVSRLPQGLASGFQMLRAGTIKWWSVLGLLAIGAVVIVAVIAIQEGSRKVPVQYAKRVVGRRQYGGNSAIIPIKVNAAGVIPVIFASSVLSFFPTIANFINKPWPWLKAIANVKYSGVTYNVIFFVLIVFFTYFYTAITFNPRDMAQNMQKYGGFIPGIRPGRPTSDYLDRIVSRVTMFGALFLGIIAIMPNFVIKVTQIPGLYFGGTSLLIVVGVALETMKQIESHLIMRQYQGFLK
jgi:preprotein translocase subunit SecY